MQPGLTPLASAGRLARTLGLMTTALPALRFHSSDGHAEIETPLPVVLVRGMRRQAVRDSLDKHFRSATKTHADHEWLNFGGISFGGKPCSLSAVFEHGLLQLLTFSVQLHADQAERGWPTPAEIQEEVEFVRTELTAQLGSVIAASPARFTWGSAWSFRDPKGGLASSGVRYEA